jgi:hypothetical protein
VTLRDPSTPGLMARQWSVADPLPGASRRCRSGCLRPSMPECPWWTKVRLALAATGISPTKNRHRLPWYARQGLCGLLFWAALP